MDLRAGIEREADPIPTREGDVVAAGEVEGQCAVGAAIFCVLGAGEIAVIEGIGKWRPHVNSNLSATESSGRQIALLPMRSREPIPWRRQTKQRHGPTAACATDVTLRGNPTRRY